MQTLLKMGLGASILATISGVVGFSSMILLIRLPEEHFMVPVAMFLLIAGAAVAVNALLIALAILLVYVLRTR